MSAAWSGNTGSPVVSSPAVAVITLYKPSLPTIRRNTAPSRTTTNCSGLLNPDFSDFLMSNMRLLLRGLSGRSGCMRRRSYVRCVLNTRDAPEMKGPVTSLARAFRAPSATSDRHGLRCSNNPLTMPLTKQLTERAEQDKLDRDSSLPPGGQRSGEGAASVLPYLSESLSTKPGTQPPAGDQRPAGARRPEAPSAVPSTSDKRR